MQADDLVFNKGDKVTVVGTEVQFEVVETIFAREVTQGDPRFPRQARYAELVAVSDAAGLIESALTELCDDPPAAVAAVPVLGSCRMRRRLQTGKVLPTERKFAPSPSLGGSQKNLALNASWR